MKALAALVLVVGLGAVACAGAAPCVSSASCGDNATCQGGLCRPLASSSSSSTSGGLFNTSGFFPATSAPASSLASGALPSSATISSGGQASSEASSGGNNNSSAAFTGTCGAGFSSLAEGAFYILAPLASPAASNLGALVDVTQPDQPAGILSLANAHDLTRHPDGRLFYYAGTYGPVRVFHPDALTFNAVTGTCVPPAAAPDPQANDTTVSTQACSSIQGLKMKPDGSFFYKCYNADTRYHDSVGSGTITVPAGAALAAGPDSLFSQRAVFNAAGHVTITLDASFQVRLARWNTTGFRLVVERSSPAVTKLVDVNSTTGAVTDVSTYAADPSGFSGVTLVGMDVRYNLYKTAQNNGVPVLLKIPAGGGMPVVVLTEDAHSTFLDGKPLVRLASTVAVITP